MRIPDLLTPAERRLAGLLFVLSVLGLLVRGAERVDPRVRTWLESAPPGTEPPSPAGEPPLEATAAVADSIAAPTPEPSTPQPDARPVPEGVDPNTAGAEALTRLPGIGPALAARIVADRERNGPYHAPADLLRVPGIGAATLRKIEPHLRLGAAGGPGG